MSVTIEEDDMYLIAICAVGFCILIFGFARRKRLRERADLQVHSIEPEALRELLDVEAEVLLFDVRQPLDFLAHPEIIPGAMRIAPSDLLRNTSLIPKEKDAVIYCTCPSDETSLAVLKKARAMKFSRVRFLRGGFEEWKAKGFPVVRYGEPFHLDTAS
jgi:rhodanese-related sulfurtransferase